MIVSMFVCIVIKMDGSINQWVNPDQLMTQVLD